MKHRYRAKQVCFVDGARIRPGQEFSTSASPNDAWEPIDKPAAEPEKAAAKAAPAPAPKDDDVVDDPFEKMDEQTARTFIQTKGGRQPGQKATIETVRAAARSAAGLEEA